MTYISIKHPYANKECSVKIRVMFLMQLLITRTRLIFSKPKKDTFNIESTLNSLAIIFAKNDFFEEAENYRYQVIALAEKSKS